MAAAIIGLVGATIGALATVFGTFISEKRQERREERIWRRDQRSAAYNGALHHLLRAANLRSGFAIENGKPLSPVIKTEDQREWFEDLVQAQFWLHSTTHHCTPEQIARLTEATDLLDTMNANMFVSGDAVDTRNGQMTFSGNPSEDESR